jgi:hypothetical protein
MLQESNARFSSEDRNPSSAIPNGTTLLRSSPWQKKGNGNGRMQPACGSNNLKVVDVADMDQTNEHLRSWFDNFAMNGSDHAKVFDHGFHRQHEPGPKR